MATLLRTSTLVVSVDLEAPAGCSQPSVELARGAHRPLLNLLNELAVPGTWCVAAPGDWKAAIELIVDTKNHELAILGSEAWTKPSTGRQRFVSELQLHLAKAERAGYQPTSLALSSGNVASSADLAQKLGITAIRTASTVAPFATGISGLVQRVFGRNADAERAYQPSAVRFGVWDLKPSAIWPHPTRSQDLRVPVGSLRRALELAIDAQSVFHLVLNGTAVAEAGDAAIRGLRKFFAHADRRRRQTRLAMLSMQDLVARLASPRTKSSAHSILRRAA